MRKLKWLGCFWIMRSLGKGGRAYGFRASALETLRVRSLRVRSLRVRRGRGCGFCFGVVY